MKEMGKRQTCNRRVFLKMNSFSRVSDPRSEDARGNERSSSERTGLDET